MRKSLLFFVICIGLGANAQKITTSKVDKFTKKETIETSFEKISSDEFLPMNRGPILKSMWVAFSKDNGTTYLRLKWPSNEYVSMLYGTKVVLLDAEGNNYPFTIDTDLSVTGTGKGATGRSGRGIWGNDVYLVGDCSALKGKVITDLRVATPEGNIDVELNKKKYNTISQTYIVFENEEKIIQEKMRKLK